jgi:hypothetical protein
MTPEPKRALPRKPALKTVMMARPLAFARIWGGIILSGPKDCFGSMKEARILPVFLHSPIEYQNRTKHGSRMARLTLHGRGQWVVDERHVGRMRWRCLMNWRFGDEQKGTRQEQHRDYGMEKRVGQAQRRERTRVVL